MSLFVDNIYLEFATGFLGPLCCTVVFTYHSRLDMYKLVLFDSFWCTLYIYMCVYTVLNIGVMTKQDFLCERSNV